MSLNIKNEEAHRLAKALADATGKTLTAAVTDALRHQIRDEVGRGVEDEALLLAEVGDIQRLVAALPDRDTRTPEEILGYDAHGLPS